VRRANANILFLRGAASVLKSFGAVGGDVAGYTKLAGADEERALLQQAR
jgi:hypothetical protein